MLPILPLECTWEHSHHPDCTLTEIYILPLPTLQITSETTENIAEGIKTTFDMLACASDSELYENVDVHMTDSTAHNKGLAKQVADKLDRDDPARTVVLHLTHHIGV